MPSTSTATPIHKPSRDGWRGAPGAGAAAVGRPSPNGPFGEGPAAIVMATF